MELEVASTVNPQYERPHPEDVTDEPTAKRIKLDSGADENPTMSVDTEPSPSTAISPEAGNRSNIKKHSAKKGGKVANERKRVRSRNEEAATAGGRNAERTQTGDDDKVDGEKGKRLAKRKVALLMSFCGTGCSGMQFQHSDAVTIEGLLFKALVTTGAISADNSDHPAKVDLQRAARTDAGVHAAGNVVSIKMIVDPPLPVSNELVQSEPSEGSSSGVATAPATHDQLIAHINSLLPPQIRVWSFLRTRNTFNARKECDSRRYEYLFPSWMLLPPKPTSNVAKMLVRLRASQDFLPSQPHPFWSKVTDLEAKDTITDVEEDLSRKRLWRIDEPTLDRFKAVLKTYEGTHNFHNFTVGRDFNDRASKRYMMRVEVMGVNVLEDGVEWISVLFHGQSFMLHQRKMVSMAILTCRTETPPTLIPETYGPRRIIVPMAPSLGLLLEQPIFGSYNQRVNSENETLSKQKLSAEESSARRRDEIDFSKHSIEIDAFKKEFIYERMREEERKVNVFDKWIRLIDAYQGEDLTYLNPRGVIPASAVIKKGEKRANGIAQASQGAEPDEEAEGHGVSAKDLEEMEG